MADGWFTRRRFLGGAAALGGGLVLGSSLTGCAELPTGDTGKAMLNELRSAGVARLAIGNEPPYTQIKTDGSVTGAEPEVARAVLRMMGIDDVQGIITPYEGMIPGLNARQWDLITAGLYMNRSRCAEIIYSEPDIVSTESFALRKGNPTGIETLADVKADSSITIAVLAGGYEDGLLRTEKVPRGQISAVPDGRSGIEGLQAGRVDVFLLPTLSLRELVADNASDIEVSPPVPDIAPTGSGVGFRKTDGYFRDLFNEKFQELKDSGEFAAIIEPWGFPADEAINTTAEELCQAPG
ncbi:polar amino acid transport system substrate-binding protein [Tamaricihabitans halophyticus]|uniref:Polar amino acid transport system substrate-binding protein n=1 Tax=Tamaricihabitans halophyticus TaxID=1262583 RepID=A0A4R2QLU2_9PSEU|nr:ectoine/hydroxyectoine ABC transporter substrate-binding protein EhuB [Tamaricihabitans halophyticus]TCP47965.1 polar amino acid transport system substrate-binding protein [Tamaricihabitans halophyticus]